MPSISFASTANSRWTSSAGHFTEHDMTDQVLGKPQSLEAKSPFERRINQGRSVPDPEVRAAIATGDLGFLHSFTTGSAVDGPGIRVVAWTTLCMFRCRYCHNPDTRTITNGTPITLAHATDELRKYAVGLK